MGKTGADWVKLIWPATETLGSPLITRLETEQPVGVIVSAVWMDPPPLLFKAPSTSPVTAIVPPPGQATLSETGKLQFSGRGGGAGRRLVRVDIFHDGCETGMNRFFCKRVRGDGGRQGLIESV